ncbi:pectate lyase [Terricaulis silvestris]|uniref:Pectate lyase n=1 Tax=Terricaulis silvestris TaxID=2686094 RepID=A0A6I6MIL6_9CAUL|nr:pectate lyase [Terricaulis silvestris]
MRVAPLTLGGLVCSMALGAVAFVSPGCASAQEAARWSEAIVEQDDAVFASAQMRAVADNVVLHQSAAGGWPKNTNLADPPAGPASPNVANTIDNNGTTLPMEFLARVISAGSAQYRPSFERGLDYLLAAQYANGGWPQFYPLRGGYYDHVTFNDNAMIHVMTLLRDISGGEAPYGFVDADRRRRAGEAVERGLALILRTQIRQGDALTAWCAQYDGSLHPAWARAYEPPSLSGAESVGIVRFLMAIDHPSPEVIAAVEGAATWLSVSAIEGARVETFTDAEGQRDRRVVDDANAPPIWARFYELETNRPLFLGRDSAFHYTFAEIERERRAGYNYYGDWARTVLDRFPAWRARVGATQGR